MQAAPAGELVRSKGAQRAAVEAHGGDVERSLAAVHAGEPTRVGLASLGDPDIEPSFGHVGSAHPQISPDEDDPNRTAVCRWAPPTASGSASSGRMPGADGSAHAVSSLSSPSLRRT
jgi:hypothetical protein